MGCPVDLQKLFNLEKKGFCWSIGKTRISSTECRIWPASQQKRKPVVIETGKDFADAINRAVRRVGDALPHE